MVIALLNRMRVPVGAGRVRGAEELDARRDALDLESLLQGVFQGDARGSSFVPVRPDDSLSRIRSKRCRHVVQDGVHLARVRPGRIHPQDAVQELNGESTASSVRPQYFETTRANHTSSGLRSRLG